MILKSDFVKSLLSVGGGALVLNLGRFVVVLISVRYIKPYDLGIYFLIMAAVGIITSVAGFGTNVSLVKFIVEEENNNKKISLATVTIVFFLISLLTVIAILTIFNSAFNLFEIRLSYVYLCVSFALFFYLNYILQGLKKFKAISIANSINGISKICIAFVFIVIMEIGFEGLIWTIIISNIAGVFLQTYNIYNGVSVNSAFSFEKRGLIKILKFSMPIYFNQIYSNLYDRGYTILIAALLNPTAVAYYNIATRIPAFVDQLRQVYNAVYFPQVIELLKENREKAKKLLSISVSLSFITIALGSLAFYLFKNQIVIIIFSQEYKTVSLAAFIMLARCSLSFCGPIMGFSLVALGHNSAPLRINLITTSISFLASFFVIPYLGYMGVVYVAFACSILGFIFNYFYLQYVGFSPELNSSAWIAFGSFILLIVLLIVKTSSYLLLITTTTFFVFSAFSIYDCRKHTN